MPPKSIPLTWRNVAAPSGGAALNAFNTAGQNLGKSISGIGDALNTGFQDYADAETADFLNDLNAERDPAARQAMIDASHAFLDMKQVNTAQKANIVEDRASTNFDNAQTTFDNAQTTFANTQTKFLQDQADRPQDKLDEAAARTRSAESHRIAVNRANDARLKQWREANVVNSLLGNPLSPRPELVGQDSVPSVAPVPSTPSVAPVPPVSAPAEVAPKEPEFSPVQQAAINSGSRTADEIRANKQINAIASSVPISTEQLIAQATSAETGNRGAIASDDPNSSASGTLQVIDANLKTPPYGISPQQPGESKADAKERIGKAMVEGAYQKYGSIPKTAAAHRFGDNVAANWDGNPETLEAAVRQFSNLSSAKATKALSEWNTYLGRWEGRDTSAASVTQAQQTFAPRPTVANNNIFKDLSGIKSNVNFPVIQAERTAAIQARAKWAILDKNKLTEASLATKNPLELRKIWTAAQKNMPKQLAQDEGAKALLDAMERAGVDTSTITSQKAAREATVYKARQAFTQRVANPEFDPLSVNISAISKRTGMSVDEVSAIVAPKQVRSLLEQFVTKMKSNEKFGRVNQFNAFTIDPDSGVEEYNRSVTAFKKEYTHISKSQWTDFEADAKALFSIKAATDKAAIKRQNTRALETKRIEYINELNATKGNLAKTHNIHSVYKAFPDIRDFAINDTVEILRDKVIFPKVGPGDGSIEMKETDKKWILHEAMKLVGRTNQNYLFYNTFETGSNIVADRSQKTIIKDVQDSVNILVKTYAKPNGRAVVNGNNIKLLGSVLDIPQYDTASK